MQYILRFFNDLWFRQEQPLSLGIFRILFGIFLFLHFCLNFGNWERLFGTESIVPLASQSALFTRTNYSLFAHCDNTGLWFFFWLALVSSLFFTIGYWTRFSTIILYAVLNSCKLRDPWAMEGGEHVSIVVLFVLLLSPIGESFSLSTYLKSRKNKKKWPGGSMRTVWSIWLLRVFLTLLYASSFFHKFTESDHWRTGKALYNVLLYEQHSRLISIDIIHNPIVTSALTYGTLVIEFLAPILIWIPPARPWLALALMGLHLGIMLMLKSATEMFNLLMVILMVVLIDNRLIQNWMVTINIDNIRKFFTITSAQHKKTK